MSFFLFFFLKSLAVFTYFHSLENVLNVETAAALKLYVIFDGNSE